MTRLRGVTGVVCASEDDSDALKESAVVRTLRVDCETEGAGRFFSGLVAEEGRLFCLPSPPFRDSRTLDTEVLLSV